MTVPAGKPSIMPECNKSAAACLRAGHLHGQKKTLNRNAIWIQLLSEVPSGQGGGHPVTQKKERLGYEWLLIKIPRRSALYGYGSHDSDMSGTFFGHTPTFDR